MFVRQTKKLRIPISQQGKNSISTFLRRHPTSFNLVIETISTDSASEISRLITKMMITDQEATELKCWIVKKLEDMYTAPPSMPAS